MHAYTRIYIHGRYTLAPICSSAKHQHVHTYSSLEAPALARTQLGKILVRVCVQEACVLTQLGKILVRVCVREACVLTRLGASPSTADAQQFAPVVQAMWVTVQQRTNQIEFGCKLRKLLLSGTVSLPKRHAINLGWAPALRGH